MVDRSFDNLPLEWVRAFEAAARCGSFTGAGGETGLTQSAISQRIGHLERRLGTRLFVRQARSIALTVEGEAWLPHVRTALESLRESSEALFGVSRDRLTISASTSVIDLWIAPRLEKLMAAIGGQITFRTMVLSTDAAHDDDTVRIRYGTGDWPQTYKLPLYPEVMAPLAAPSLLRSGVPWQDLPRIAVSGPRPGWTEWCALTGTPTVPVPVLRFDTFASAMAAARDGRGILLASLPLSASDLTAGTLTRIGDETLPYHAAYWLIASKDRVTRAQWAALTDALVAR